MAAPDTALASTADFHLYPDLLTAQDQKRRSIRVLHNDSSQKNTEHTQKGRVTCKIDEQRRPPQNNHSGEAPVLRASTHERTKQQHWLEMPKTLMRILMNAETCPTAIDPGRAPCTT